MDYETVIGLEVHVELHTKSKLFCNCENRFGAPPNSLVCPVCLGLPGTLPVINEEALNKHIKTALALGCEIATYSKLDRKNYFYPDMPKNYQISQYDLPLAIKGELEISDEQGNPRKIGITRIHIEEDTGKSRHMGDSKSIASADYTLLDYNRAGVPLLEIVSEPDMSSPEEAYNYLVNLKKILTWLEVSDCKMEEGSLRCDANISLRPMGSKKLGCKVEIKNMNSFRGVRNALEFEVKRQKELLEDGKKIVQETRGWEDDKGLTISMRSKEEAHDYRYFPEPDLPPIKVGQDWLQDIQSKLPEMPKDMAQRLVRQYDIPEYDSEVLTSSRQLAKFFEKSAKIAQNPKQVSNWLMGDISAYLNSKDMKITRTELKPEALGKMVKLIDEEVISGKIAKKLIKVLLEKGGDPEKIVEENCWKQITSKRELRPLIDKVIEENNQAVQDYLEGRESIKQFLVGQVMKASRGKASPKFANTFLDEALAEKNQGQGG
ncbi:MAG: Asp-tRNA(Asn)/Glu-tRNA(Gln) amidotransferase subunit GatB [Vulcanimicrobiota bacterium]